jgi:hypothetical protein
MSITSSKISFGTQFKAHIGANHAARHLRLKKLGNKQKKEKVVQGALTSTVWKFADSVSCLGLYGGLYIKAES